MHGEKFPDAPNLFEGSPYIPILMRISYFDGESPEIKGYAWAEVSPDRLAQDARSKSASMRWNTIEKALSDFQRTTNESWKATLPGSASMTHVQLQDLVGKVTTIMAREAEDFATNPEKGRGIYVV
jgi:hypothetical protein